MKRTTKRTDSAVIRACVDNDPILTEAAENILSGMIARKSSNFGPVAAAMFVYDLGRFLALHRKLHPKAWGDRP